MSTYCWIRTRFNRLVVVKTADTIVHSQEARLKIFHAIILLTSRLKKVTHRENMKLVMGQCQG